ncbi:signal recognition particle subunit srp68 [Spiromyces aspiralis]|uniref:Signal recognition particle subunit srp68 n=1 Tax=Spiromyces aspiralis TaxID=68401 RepID=A0ACC1HH61_9FUNG|nr:signal recognition particle subunit srp68 [Spiromyces aspiralis]
MLQGSGKKYQKKAISIEQIRKDVRALEVLVIQAERAWALGMELKESYSRTEEPRQRYHLIRRLRAAAKAAATLVAKVSECCAEVSLVLSAHAYLHYLQALLAFEQEEWERALDYASIAHHLYGVLRKSRSVLSSCSSNATAITAFVAELAPVIRLAAYQIQLPGAQLNNPEGIADIWYDKRQQSGGLKETVVDFASLEAKLDEYQASFDSPAAATSGSVSERVVGEGPATTEVRGEGVAELFEIPWMGRSVRVADQGLKDTIVGCLKSLESLPSLNALLADPNTVKQGTNAVNLSLVASMLGKETLAKWKQAISQAGRYVSELEGHRKTDRTVQTDPKIMHARFTHAYCAYVYYSLQASVCLVLADLVQRREAGRESLAEVFSVVAVEGYSERWDIDPASLDLAKTLGSLWTSTRPSSLMEAYEKLDQLSTTTTTTTASSDGNGSAGAVATAVPLLKIVVLHYLAFQRLRVLGRYVRKLGESIAELSAEALFDVDKLTEEIRTGKAWIVARKQCYLAALHTHPQFRFDRHSPNERPVCRAIGLLRHARDSILPPLAQRCEAARTHSDGQWNVVSHITPQGLKDLEVGIEVGTRVCQAVAVLVEQPEPMTKSRPHPWITAPAAPPGFVPNPVVVKKSRKGAQKKKAKRSAKKSKQRPQVEGESSSVGKRSAARADIVPNLVSLRSPEYAIIPSKPIFYDLANKFIDFDMDVIEFRAASVSNQPGEESMAQAAAAKISSLISGFWGSK